MTITQAELIDKMYEEAIEQATRHWFQTLSLEDGPEVWRNHAEATRHFQKAQESAGLARQRAIAFLLVGGSK